MTRILTSTAVSALFAGTVFAGTALAQTDPADYCSQGWSSIDTDNDGTVSAAEFDTGTSTDFTSMDSNGDGMVSRQEYTDCHTQAMQSMQTTPSTDSDQDFGTLDADASGGISADEYSQSAQARAQSGTSAGTSGDESELEPSAGGDTTASATMGSDDEAAAQASYVFRYLDADGDGEISETEWTSGGAAQASTQVYENRFSEIDTDGDGNLSQEEFNAARTQQRDEAQQSAEQAGEDTSVGVPVYHYRFYVR